MNYRHYFSMSVLLAAIGLVACGTTANNQYTDNDALERPPTIDMAPVASGKEEITRAEAPKKPDKGLGSDVSINTSSPLQISMARPFDMAWHDVELVLKELGIEIKDREHDKGQYYVTFDADDYQAEDSGFLAKSTSFFRNDYKQAVYIITVEHDGSNDARIVAALANDAEQTSHSEFNDKDKDLADGADKLLLSVYKNLHDELIEE